MLSNENMPTEIKKWNWGAFFLTWLWGIGNKTYIAFLVFAPIIGFFMPFVLGFRGNEWAWKNKEWESIEEFRRTQKKWSIAGIIFAISMFIITALIIGLLFSSLSKIEPVDDALNIVNNNPQSQEILGTPIKKGFLIGGSIETAGPSGYADISIPVKGTKEKGTLFVQAKKEMGIWEIEGLILEVKDKNIRINLIE